MPAIIIKNLCIKSRINKKKTRVYITTHDNSVTFDTILFYSKIGKKVFPLYLDISGSFKSNLAATLSTSDLRNLILLILKNSIVPDFQIKNLKKHLSGSCMFYIFYYTQQTNTLTSIYR